MAGAVPTVETDRLDVMELQRRLALVDRDGQELVLAERIGCFGPDPMRSDRMLRPHHNDDTGLRNRFLDLRVVGVALLDAAAVDPDRHAFLPFHGFSGLVGCERESGEALLKGDAIRVGNRHGYLHSMNPVSNI
jgi:hypothetical protein